MKQYLLPLLAAALLASGCASSPSTPSATAPAKPAVTAEQANAAIAAAEKSQAAAAKVGYEWRDTGKMIEEAKKAAAASEFDKALKLATQAEHEGNLAVKQHAIEVERLSKK